MTQDTTPPNDHATVSIEKALLADLCLGLPLGRLVFDLPDTSVPEASVPDTYLFHGTQLAALKHAAIGGHETARRAVEALSAAADKALNATPPSVVDKPRSRFSDDPHDYQSLAKYHWPDPARPDGFPWIRRDGDINPDCYSDDFDYLRLCRLAENTTVLAVAAYLTDDARYGAHAAAMLRRWFITPETRQNPNFALAQVIPSGAQGPHEGRWAGLIEARFLIYVTEAIRLLESAGQLDQPTGAGLRSWFGQLLDWMLESPAGRQALAAKNNIALWQGLQCMVYADFCGRTHLAETCMQEHVLPQIPRQIAPDGSLPHELGRARPHDYVAFSLAAMALIARAGEHQGLQLWDQQDGDGRNFQAPHDWLLRATRASNLLLHASPPGDAASAPFDPANALDIALQLRGMQRAVQAQSKEHEALLAEHRALTSKYAALQTEYSNAQTAHDTLQKNHAQLTRYALRLEHALHTLLNSRSWKLVRPLRWLAGRMRGVRLPEKVADFLPPRPPALSPQETLAHPPAAVAASYRSSVPASVTVSPAKHLASLRNARPDNEDALRAAYQSNPLRTQPDTFVLYRILGNDLYPRHRKGQSRENLRFVLENEPPLPGCEKRWIVNRIVDPDEEQRIIELLTAHGQEYIRIPFVADEYRRIGWDLELLPTPDFLQSEAFRNLSTEEQERVRIATYRLKNLYVMNNNGARNAALRDGRTRAKWVLPWDGNCFVTAQAWSEIVAAVSARPHLKYFAVPMERMLDNSALLRGDYRPNPVEEPQLLFRCDTTEEFNEAFPYGRRPKVEMFWRLGIPGIWDTWIDDPWDPPRRPLSPDAGQFGCAGWVARLFSGQEQQETAHARSRKNRLHARRDAIVATIDAIDQRSQPNADFRPAPPPDEPSVANLCAIYANRSDGLGERLRGIFNAIVISEITGAPFKFAWPMKGWPRDHHAINAAHEIFSERFIREYFDPSDGAHKLPRIALPKGNLQHVRNVLTDALGHSPYASPQTPSLINLLKAPEDTLATLTRKAVDKMEFAPRIARIRDMVLHRDDFPAQAAAIHLRAGDVLYGRHADNPRWLNKVICAPMAAVLARHLKGGGMTPVFFGQEPHIAHRLAKRFDCCIAEDFNPQDCNSDLEIAFADIFLMSRCSVIYAGNSGFAKIASQFSRLPQHNPLDVYKAGQWPQLLHEEVSNHAETYSPEQRAYAYFTCYYYALQAGMKKELSKYISLARHHNPKNNMYAFLEAITPLHTGELQKAEELMSAYFEDAIRQPEQKFSKTERVQTLCANSNGGLVYARFLPHRPLPNAGYPRLRATISFLQRQMSPESVETLRRELL